MTERQLDERISKWLEAEAPGQVPDRVLRATFERTRSSRQHFGWRALLGRNHVNRSALQLGAAALVVVVAALALGVYVNKPTDVGPQPTATASPSPIPTSSPSPLTFTSTLHGISLDYPGDWLTRPATEGWAGGDLSFDSPAADVIFDPAFGDRLYLLLASQAYGRLSQNEWKAEVLAWTCPGGIRDFGSWTVDGAHAEHGGPCNSGVLVFEDTRGYLIRLVVASDEPALAATYNWDWPRPMLGTVELRPEAASGSMFTSTTHGVSIEYPSNWLVRPATGDWDQGAFTFDAPGVDVLFDPAHQDDLYISIASAPLGDQSAEDWCCSELWAAAQVCETGGNFGRVTLAGAAATIRGCDGPGNSFEDHVVQAATAMHGYVIYLHVAQDPNLQVIYTETWFDDVLETLVLP